MTFKLIRAVKGPYQLLGQGQHNLVFQRKKLVERIKAHRASSPFSQLACHRYHQSQLQEWVFKPTLWKQHPGCSMESWNFISRMTAALNFFRIGVSKMRLHGSLATANQKKRFSGILFVFVGQCQTATNNHQEVNPQDTTSKSVSKYQPNRS